MSAATKGHPTDAKRPDQPRLAAEAKGSAEEWLLERLKRHGVDVYAPAGPFANLRERLGCAIAENRFGSVVVGRHDGKPETYQQFYERVFGLEFPAPADAARIARGGSAP